MQGGVAQAIGWALNEEYVYDEDGILRNSSLWIIGCQRVWICR